MLDHGTHREGHDSSPNFWIRGRGPWTHLAPATTVCDCKANISITFNHEPVLLEEQWLEK